MALALGWLEIAGYGGRKRPGPKRFSWKQGMWGERRRRRRRRGESICHHPTCYNKEIMSNPTSYPKKRKLTSAPFFLTGPPPFLFYKHPFFQLHNLHEFRSIWWHLKRTKFWIFVFINIYTKQFVIKSIPGSWNYHWAPSFLRFMHCPAHMAWEWYSSPHFSFLVCLFVCFGMWALHGLSILRFIYIACLLQVLYIIRSRC